jgi:isopentenyl diphosphate isomerase/L-lactate dehydrogenase-like FMN-dependent dehydrogenase
VIDILRAEFEMTMRQCGTTSIKDITRASVKRV